MSIAPDLLSNPSSAIELLADFLARRWAAGERVLVEEILAEHPHLASHPDLILDLLAEELVLRQDYGLPTHEAAVQARFPELADQVKALFECQQWLGAGSAQFRFPSAGEDLGEFHLLSEIGRGVAGRVFLAVQSGLADRPVVLKTTLALAHETESLSLARLQHTNIVPLYSVHDFASENLRGLCMPYFGGTTLARVLHELPTTNAAHGFEVVTALRSSAERSPVQIPVQGPLIDFLSLASRTNVACWIGACLAEALHYAHERNLLHLDVKPSNVLITADGTPMLLDFHLAQSPLHPGQLPRWLGGTPEFSPPEQQEAIAALRNQQPIPNAIDIRADLYSLGLTVGMLLRDQTGRYFSNVSTGVIDLIEQCTSPNPSDRHPSAHALAIDFRRQLADLPFQTTRNRSWVELWQKWRRRRPHALPLGLAFAALLTVGATGAQYVYRQAERGQEAFESGNNYLANGRYAEASEAFRGGQLAVKGLPFCAKLSQQLATKKQQADANRVALDLETLANQLRPLYGIDSLTPEQVQSTLQVCTQIWDKRDEFLTFMNRAALERSNALLDIGIITTYFIRRNAELQKTIPRDLTDANKVLDEAEQLFGPSPVLYLERSLNAKAVGNNALAIAAEQQAFQHDIESAWEYWAVGRAHLAREQYHLAEEALDQAIERDPRLAWAYYHRGVCALATSNTDDALAAFSACLALSPETGWCWYNRGLTFAIRGNSLRAIADYHQAIRLDPTLIAARLARATEYGRVGNPDLGFSDLEFVEAHGVTGPELQYAQAVLFNAKGMKEQARETLQRVLKSNPDHQPARRLLNQLVQVD